MRLNLIGRLTSILPLIGMVVVGVVAVTSALTVLAGNEQPSLVVPSAVLTPIPPPTGATPVPLLSREPDITFPVPSSAPRVTSAVNRGHDPAGAWAVDFRYPQLVGGTTPLAHLVNIDVRSEVETRVESFVSGPAAVRDPAGVNALTGRFSVEMLTNRVASFVLRWVDNTSSKTKPTTSVETLTYGLDSGRRLDFGDVFTDQPGALNILSAESRLQLQRNLGDAYDATTAEAGTLPQAGYYVNWSLTPAGLKVTFDMFQVGPYEVGTPTVVVPWSRLAPVVRADGPAGRLAGLQPSGAPPSPSGGPSVAPS